MLRFYNPYTYEHLYTPSEEEAASLRAAGWNEEGIGWYSPVKGTQGVETIYRLYNPWGDDHLYTTNAKEKDDCLARGMKLDYKFEAYGFAAKSEVANQPVYRLFNPYEQEHTHFFTTNPSEVSDNVARGWKDEHEQWFVPGKPAETPAAGASNVIIGVGTGTGSNPSSSSESSTPGLSKELSKEQQADLKEASKSVEERIDDARKTAMTVTTADGKKLTGDAAVTELTARATAATTAYNEAKKASDAKPNDAALKAKTDAAALVQKEKEFEAEYAKNLNLLAQKKAELDKKPNDDKAKQAFNEAKTAVETDEKKVVPVTYTLHFTNDPKGTATLKDTQVTVYKCIASQMYGKSEEAVKTASARYTEAAAVLDVVNDTHQVQKDDKLKLRRVRYNAETKAYDVTFTTYDDADATPKAHDYQVPALAKDEHAPSDLPELNMTLYAKDTSAYHATKDDKVGDLTTKINAITNDTLAKSPYLKLPSYRTTRVTREFVETEGYTQATKDALNKQWKAFKQEADAPDKNPGVQLAIYKLKKAEREYSTATTDEAKLKARKDAIEAAAYLINPLRGYTGMEQVSYTSDPEYVHYELLNRLQCNVLGSEAPQKDAKEEVKKNYKTYVDAYVSWMNNPKDAKLTEAVKAAYETYNGKAAPFTWDINEMIG